MEIKYCKQVEALSQKYLPEIIKLRRYFHQHPELSTQEFNTAKKITEILKALSVEFKEGIAGTGVVGIIRGKNPDHHVVALRADMDALPIEEKNDVPYKSVFPNVMHACGHDAHTACLLGAAMVLSEMKTELEGTVKLIFQPSEETFPGGAIGMIKEGVLENPNVNAVVGQHVLPTLEAGKIGLKAGLYMASTDEIYLEIIGKGGHGATPELNTDPVVIASEIVLSLQQIVSRIAKPIIPTVLSFGRFIADGRTNIIPDKVEIAGTLRTFNEQWREEALERITRISKGIAESYNAECKVRIARGYPFLNNNSDVTEVMKNIAVAFLGSDNVEELEPRMTAEDFAYFALERPSCFYRLGVKSKDWDEVRNLHTATFDLDEMSLQVGTALMALVGLNNKYL